MEKFLMRFDVLRQLLTCATQLWQTLGNCHPTPTSGATSLDITGRLSHVVSSTLSFSFNISAAYAGD
jgi:hypothetical protein